MNEPFDRNTKFFIASTTTQATIGKQFHALLKHLVEAYPENIRRIKLRQIYERFSSKMHKITSDNFKFALNVFGRSSNYDDHLDNYNLSQFRNSSIRSHSNHSQSRRTSSRSQQRNPSNNQILPLSPNHNNNLRPLSIFLQSQISVPEILAQDIHNTQDFQDIQEAQVVQDSPPLQDLSTNNIH